ncbi:MAG: relaxase domain-containing protein [Thiotrichales bacterium]|nr:relaxase domain-containing protein [Thiotrichales bacterium]
MVASIGAVASATQGLAYYEQDGYYTAGDPAHRAASAWVGEGAVALGLDGTVDGDTFRAVLEGHVPDGRGQRLGRAGAGGTVVHRPGRDLTLSAPKSVSLVALIGGDVRIVDAHDRAVRATLGWVERHAAETRMRDPATGRMVRTLGQRMVAATFRHDTSRNLDPQLHTHAVIANMLQGADGKWRTMANERLYASKMLIGTLYRAELARGLARLGYRIEKTHADGRFEMGGVSRGVVEAFSTRRAVIEAAMAGRETATPADRQRLAERAALVTRAYKRDVDKTTLRETWARQAAALGFDAPALVAEARERAAGRDVGREEKDASEGAGVEQEKHTEPALDTPADRAIAWGVAHLAEREAVFSRNALLAAALAWRPGAVDMAEAEAALGRLEAAGTLHSAQLPAHGDALTTDRALADERETLALMHGGTGRGVAPMRGRAVDKALRNGPLTPGQCAAVRLILSAKDRVVGVQGYAGTGKTVMLSRVRALAAQRGFTVRGLAPSASAARTLSQESGIESETLQRFLTRHTGVAEGRLSRKAEQALRAAFAKTVLVVDEGSLASTVQARNLLRIATALRLPRVVLVGDAKQLDAVDAGKPFAQLQAAGMPTAVMRDILRQKDPVLKAAVEASLGGDIQRAFETLGDHIEAVKPDNLPGAAAARWLALSPGARTHAGLIAPSHKLRERINAIIRERLVADGTVHGPALTTERLVSRGYTHAEKTLAAHYHRGDVVAFHRPYQRLGVAKGDTRRVLGADREDGTVRLEGTDGATITWHPAQLAARSGGVEVYRADTLELRAGDRIRWTRNDAGRGLVNSATAEVAGVKDGTVSLRLEDGRTLDLQNGDPQLRHIDRAWASTVHAFQGRTVDHIIAAMEARHPHLTTQKSFYVEISRARHRAELVTDDRAALKDRLEAATGERIAALEALAPEPAQAVESGREVDREATRESGPSASTGRATTPDKAPEPRGIETERAL